MSIFFFVVIKGVEKLPFSFPAMLTKSLAHVYEVRTKPRSFYIETDGEELRDGFN